MALVDYTTRDDVRAVLGVSSEDLEDTTLDLATYWNLLLADLESIDETLPATYDTTKAIVTPSAAEARFLRAAQVFATFSVAKQLTASLPLFALKQASDSKATGERFAEPYKETIAAVASQYDAARAALISALGAIGTTATTTARVWMSVVSPASDPVTGT